jgi:hypothetical protein
MANCSDFWLVFNWMFLMGASHFRYSVYFFRIGASKRRKFSWILRNLGIRFFHVGSQYIPN